MRLEAFRTTILLAMGLQTSCVTQGTLDTDLEDTDTDTDTGHIQTTCDSVPEATKENARQVENEGGEWLICGDIPESGTCPSLESLSLYSFVVENLGPTSDPDFCGWDVQPVCGPEEGIVDECCYVLKLGVICEGRPLRVDGTPTLADVTERDDWTMSLSLDVSALSMGQRLFLAKLWRASGQAEHASVAAFARVSLELMALGAPADLLTEVQLAMGDEIEHAKLCFGIASTLLGEGVGPAAFPQALAGGELCVETLLMGIVLDGCINETIAAALAFAESNCASSSSLHRGLAKLSADERRHAVLSWKLLRWLLDEKPELRPLAKRFFDSGIAAQWTPEAESHPWTHAWGRLSGLQRVMVIRKTLREVIVPCVSELFSHHQPKEISVATTRA